MTPDKQEEIRRSLRQLAENYAATIELMEKMFSFLCEELSTEPLAYWQSTRPTSQQSEGFGLIVDSARLSVTFRGRTCFLGNTLPFKLLARLAQRPNAFVSHGILLRDVWKGTRSEEAVRSVVKTLRSKLRQQGLEKLAEAIDGTTRGHYALRLGSN